MKTFLVALAAFAALSGTAHAATLANNTAGRDVAFSGFEGQSFTVEGVGPFNDIRFNFYDAAGNARALGNLYIFSTAYTGSPDNLAGTTAGRIGVGAAASNIYAFASSVQLQGGIKYYAYADAAFEVLGASAGTYAGGEQYFARTSGEAFADLGSRGNDANFTVTGTAVTAGVPEPATWGMMIAGFGLVGGAMRRRRTAVSFA